MYIRVYLVLLLLVSGPVLGQIAHTLDENGDGTSDLGITSIPTWGITDFCDGAGWFTDNTCGIIAKNAGLCAVVGVPLDINPDLGLRRLRTMICTVAHEAAGRCRPEQIDELIPHLMDCGAFFPVAIRRYGRGLAKRGEELSVERLDVPSTNDPFEAN